jgi:hypothetical protein
MSPHWVDTGHRIVVGLQSVGDLETPPVSRGSSLEASCREISHFWFLMSARSKYDL